MSCIWPPSSSSLSLDVVRKHSVAPHVWRNGSKKKDRFVFAWAASTHAASPITLTFQRRWKQVCHIALRHADPCQSGSHDPCQKEAAEWAVRTRSGPAEPRPALRAARSPQCSARHKQKQTPTRHKPIDASHHKQEFRFRASRCSGSHTDAETAALCEIDIF